MLQATSQFFTIMITEHVPLSFTPSTLLIHLIAARKLHPQDSGVLVNPSLHLLE